MRSQGAHRLRSRRRAAPLSSRHQGQRQRYHRRQGYAGRARRHLCFRPWLLRLWLVGESASGWLPLVTRLKANTPFEAAEERAVPADSAILSDRTGYLPKRLAGARHNPLPDRVREVQVKIEAGKVLRLFTNDLNASAEDIADLYKRRWQIELFFRWIKQTLKIKHFLGTSENAVRIQITSALIAFMLLRLAHEANKIVESPLAFIRLIRANLMQRRTIRDLLQPTPPP